MAPQTVLGFVRLLGITTVSPGASTEATTSCIADAMILKAAFGCTLNSYLISLNSIS
jgi:hypothetical protein